MMQGVTLQPLRPQDGKRRRSIFVTGAASGIGLATACLFLERGWFVGCFDIDRRALEGEFGALLAADDACVCLGALDVRDPHSCAAAVALFVAAANAGAGGAGMDALFNCAGVLAIGRFDELPLARQTAQIDINCTGVVNMTHASVEALRRARGRIVTMSSLSAMCGIPLHATYAATKAFVRSFTEALRSEFAADGIAVCDVAAPYVATTMTSSQGAASTPVFDEKQAFLGAREVAEAVWAAVHRAAVYNEHFYVGCLGHSQRLRSGVDQSGAPHNARCS